MSRRFFFLRARALAQPSAADPRAPLQVHHTHLVSSNVIALYANTHTVQKGHGAALRTHTHHAPRIPSFLCYCYRTKGITALYYSHHCYARHNCHTCHTLSLLRQLGAARSLLALAQCSEPLRRGFAAVVLCVLSRDVEHVQALCGTGRCLGGELYCCCTLLLCTALHKAGCCSP
jgi:hypothetical protein